jgi:hypothetical protein
MAFARKSRKPKDLESIPIDQLVLHPGQVKVVEGKRRFNVLECGRRFGKTALLTWILIENAKAGKMCGGFWQSYKLGIEVWDDLLRRLGKHVRSSNKTERRIIMWNGGQIDLWSFDGNPDAGRSRKYDVICVDECSIIPYLKMAWQEALRPTLTDFRGSAWFFGTPKGGNYFHQLFTKGQNDSDPDWISWRLPTTANPYIDPAEVEAARRELPPQVFDQEYMGVPADDAGNPFGLAAINRCIAPLSNRVKCHKCGFAGVETDLVKGENELFCPKCPTVIKSREVVAFGADLAKSVDFTALIGLDSENCVSFIERWQSDWSVTTPKLASIIGDRPAHIDATGVGDPIVEQLQLLIPMVTGVVFSQVKKQQLMTGLAMAINRGDIRFPEGWLADELRSFEYQYTAHGVTYSAPQGLHDDGVCALALVVDWLYTRYRTQLTWVTGSFGLKRDGIELRSSDDDDDRGWSKA